MLTRYLRDGAVGGVLKVSAVFPMGRGSTTESEGVTRLLPSGDEAGTAPEDRAFRPDVEGLRAVAVLLVVLYHAGVGKLGGGYVGVDVFFVISGFVITGVLFRERVTAGTTSLLGFYARRCRRILPAATLVLVCTVVASHLVLGAAAGVRSADDAKWAAVFLANFHFASVGTNYLAAQLPPSPLQNFWTLSVEEQFYLVFPTLFLMVAGLRLRLTLRTRLLVVLGAISVCSLSWSIIQTASNPNFAYFSPFTAGLGTRARSHGGIGHAEARKGSRSRRRDRDLDRSRGDRRRRRRVQRADRLSGNSCGRSGRGSCAGHRGRHCELQVRCREPARLVAVTPTGTYLVLTVSVALANLDPGRRVPRPDESLAVVQPWLAPRRAGGIHRHLLAGREPDPTFCVVAPTTRREHRDGSGTHRRDPAASRPWRLPSAPQRPRRSIPPHLPRRPTWPVWNTWSTKPRRSNRSQPMCSHRCRPSTWATRLRRASRPRMRKRR